MRQSVAFVFTVVLVATPSHAQPLSFFTPACSVEILFGAGNGDVPRGWGWEDDGWGAVNRNGVLLHFPEGGVQTLRIQVREDGVSIDQVVLSASQYRTARPGPAKNDDTKLEPAGPVLSWW